MYFNTASKAANYDSSCTLNYCCTTPLPVGGAGNITLEPLFVARAAENLRLQSNSPCINAGLNAAAPGSTDLDGRPRIVGGTVDIGAYEFQGGGMGEFIAWLQHYGLATAGSADYRDSDGDGMDNWHEWLAGTSPINGTSVLRLEAPVTPPPSVLLRWNSVSNRTYFIEGSTNLRQQPAFSLLRSNIPGLPNSTTFTDTNPPASGSRFYRVGVQP